ncbi:ubiquitin carboxyl-terminal hydrolase 3-like [Asterias amurensis]|uniref:ubiquitin carboxyl-terminal hydrolase 3-like n=1 Tax=Asterias amurensis TaxID=7602 RepID=UPI003AB21C70
MECPHLVNSVKQGVAALPVTRKTNNGEILTTWVCAGCRSSKSPWMCLSCGIIACGRYVNGHAKKHFEECQHSVCINCENLSVFCYECDEFVVNDTKAGAVQQIRQILQDIASAQLDNKRLKNSKDHVSDGDEEGPPKKKLATNNTKPSIPGLRNLGNTCFMNAVLQSLSNIHQFCCYFKDLPAVELRNGKSAGKRIYNTRNLKHDDVSLVEEVRKTLCALWQGGQSAISPDSLFSVMWKIFPRFRGYQQQDAHEFMRYLLDRLHTELQGTLWPGNPRRQTNGTSTIVTFMFGGLLLSQVHCVVCESFYKKIDPFLDVSLDIPQRFRSRSKSKDGSRLCRIQDCLQSFTEVEELAESEHYMCTNCQKRQPSTKKFWFRKLPNVLCMHIKRFQWTGFLRSKIDVFVQFPLRGLDLRPYILKPEESPDSESTIYDLKAVVIHQGSGAGCGHYVAFAKNDGQWFCFNDTSVSPVQEAAVTRCKAYILYYIRRKATQDDCFQLVTSLQEELLTEPSASPSPSSTAS